jgi:hypothetical protein
VSSRKGEPLARTARHVIAATVALAALLVLVVPPSRSEASFHDDYCGQVLAAGSRCWSSTTVFHTWAINQAEKVSSGNAASLCAYIVDGPGLNIIAGTSGCGTNVKTYTACYGVNNSPWKVFVEHFAAGSRYLIAGHADTYTTVC